MRRDLATLTRCEFDLLVIGGGIYGTTAAWDATLRGLSVALIDRGDFGGGTSFNSAKTVHGGVRALQSGNVAELRQFVRERRALSRLLPHLVHPLPFVIPTYRGVTRHHALMRVYFAVNDLLARDRNDLADASKHLPSSRSLSRDECLALNPLIDPSGVSGGIEWFDCQMYNSDRVNLSFVLSAVDAGAVAANYVEATALLQRGTTVEGARVRNRLGDESFDIRARVVLNGAGPWAPEILHRFAPGAARFSRRLSKAMNLVIASPLGGTHAVGGPAGGRLLFVAPWREFAIVGTSHDPYDGTAHDLAIERDEIDRFITDVNVAFPRLGLRLEDVRLVHRGLLPAASDGGGTELEKTSRVHDHRAEGVDGLVSVLGVRYTTARDTAAQAIDAVTDQLQRAVAPCRTAETPLAGGDIPDYRAFLRTATSGMADDDPISVTTRRRLARSYGSTYPTVLERLTAGGERASLGAACPVTIGEIRHAVQEEMAVKLSDALLRRTEAGSAGAPGEDALATAAGVMAAELDWSDERVEAEIAEVARVYQLPV